VIPEMTDEKVEEISNRYIELFEKVTGEKFKKKQSKNILKRMETNIKSFLKNI
jgi:phosphoribosylaminoimidazole-succinocarboxamide synthase